MPEAAILLHMRACAVAPCAIAHAQQLHCHGNSKRSTRPEVQELL